MCGIAGLFFWNGAKAGGADRAEACVERMKQALRHRGPDGEGAWSLLPLDIHALQLSFSGRPE